MPVKVFFNNSCNICKLEIDHYKKNSDENLEWVDITNNQQAVDLTSKSKEELLRRLHVEKDGKIFSGAKAFLLVWKNIPKYKILYSIFSLPIIFQIFSFIYELIAFFLYLKNKKQLKSNLK